MKAEEIRGAYSKGCENWNGFPLYTGSNGATPAILVEIAAQLAELNEGIRLLAPGPKTDAPEPYEPSEQDRHEDALTSEANAIHDAAMAKPVSDPEKLVRCNWCTNEMPLPKEGHVAICDNCIPF